MANGSGPPGQTEPRRVLWSPAIGWLYARPPEQCGPMPPLSTFDETLLNHLIEKPWPIGTAFNVAEPVTLAAATTPPTWQRVCFFPDPPTQVRMVLVRGVAMGVANLGDFDNIVWRITIDGAPVPGYDSIRGPFGVFIYPRPVLLGAYPNQTVAVEARNLTAVAITNVTASLMGSTFPADPNCL